VKTRNSKRVKIRTIPMKNIRKLKTKKVKRKQKILKAQKAIKTMT